MAAGLSALAFSVGAQLTDEQIQQMKRQSGASPPPAIVEFEGLGTEECHAKAARLGVTGERTNYLCPERVPVGQNKLSRRPLSAREIADRRIARVEVDCATGRDAHLWRHSDPLPPGYVHPPADWPKTLGIQLKRFTWRVHTRSRNQEKTGWLTPEVNDDLGYHVCAVRVSRVSDIGNGNKWKASFKAASPGKTSQPRVRVQYKLKPRNWRTDSDLSSQTFLFEVYSLRNEGATAMWDEIQSPTVKPSVMDLIWSNKINCLDWSNGNDDFLPPPPPRPKEKPVNPFSFIPASQVVATGRVYCDNGDSVFGAYVQSSADGETCEVAKAEVAGYFAAKDRCRFQGDRTYPSWSAKPGITWIQTGFCR